MPCFLPPAALSHIAEDNQLLVAGHGSIATLTAHLLCSSYHIPRHTHAVLTTALQMGQSDSLKHREKVWLREVKEIA